jgi:ribosomal peptide maturation radical SAM protein 1
MPYAAIERPSIGLGLLVSVLAEEGISSVVEYANLRFAEKVGLRRYKFIMTAPTTFLIGEWTFARAAFPEAAERDERYLTLLGESVAQSGTSSYNAATVVDDVRALRAAAGEFIEDIAQRVLATGVRIVACTSTFEQHVASLAVLKRVRELDPAIITMIGGANCETVMGSATHRCFPWVDYVVSGEADGLIAGLCRLVLAHGRDVPVADLPAGVLGPHHRVQDPGSRTSRALPRALFRDLDRLPVPDFADYFAALGESAVRDRIRPGLPLETSRGCWWGDKHQCTFCGLNGSSMAFRSKSPDKVIAEIQELERRHEISGFEVVDNILDMKYFNSLVPFLADQDANRSFFYEVKANLSYGQLQMLAKAGIRWLQPGIESLHSEVLRLMGKGVRGWQNIQLLRWASELGVRLSWSIIWGFPGERESYYRDMEERIPLLEHLQPPGGINHVRYDRYSVYHRDAQKMNMILLPVPAMAFVYPVGPCDLDDLTYFFTTDPGRDQLESPDSGEMSAGVAAALKAIRDWGIAYGSRPAPVLSVMDRDGVLNIRDTRNCAPQRHRTLRGLERAVLLACGVAPRPEHLPELVRERYQASAEDRDVMDIARELVDGKLVLSIDGRLLSLPVTSEARALPPQAEFPGGYLILAGLQGPGA